MTYESLVAVIVLLVGSHYASLIYRLHKAEGEIAVIRKEFTDSILEAAKAAVIASQAIAAAAAAVANGGVGKNK